MIQNVMPLKDGTDITFDQQGVDPQINFNIQVALISSVSS